MKELNRDAIREMLAGELAVLDDCGTFDGEILRSTLYDAGYTCVVEEFSHAEEYALAAALEYFDGDIKQAIATIERGGYRHYPDVYNDDYEELARAIVFEDTRNIHPDIPDYILDYIDYEQLGKDIERDFERGKFTNFGYFAPERW